MIRFNLPPERKPPSFFSWRAQWRLLLLVAALGLVLITMDRFRRPEMAAALDLMLAGPSDVAENEPQSDEGAGADGTWSALEGIDWSIVRDNSYFRPEESGAWFEVLGHLRNVATREFALRSIGEVTYAQLADQSEIYRGKVVTVRGTVRRTEIIDAPTNEIGLQRYTRLVVQPEGERNWPVIVYCLELPADFPFVEDSAPEVTVSGVFFKTWSYSWEGGMGLAPVILAKEPRWMSGPATPPAEPTADGNPLLVFVVAGAAAAVIVALVWWKGSRFGAKIAQSTKRDQAAENIDVAAAMQNCAEPTEPTTLTQ